ncbi:MAG: tetratricopeptide repeat protein [Chlamydiae bacterium]|nr:tetratricopeptide repeat protein [Chlamydiota bacterium]
MKRIISVLFLFFALTSQAPNPSLKALYNSLDPKSISQNFAFYELYPKSEEGTLALKKALELLDQKNAGNLIILPKIDIQLMISLVNKKATPTVEKLSEEQLKFIEDLGKNLYNRNLKGHNIWTEKEAVSLPSEDIDLARALFVSAMENDKDGKYKIRYYEACLDLMALQILAKFPPNPTYLDKIYAINDFIFYQMKFRFPPTSSQAKNIDTYTFLPSVIDSRKGVCLGVSTLYLCLAQRLNLNLDIVTPPGHIFIRYIEKQNEFINIETTARGINLPTEIYLNIETKKLQQRKMKEVVGLTFVNQASVSWQNEDYKEAIALYEKALKFLPDDATCKELLAFNYLFVGKTKEGEQILQEIKDDFPDYAVSKDTIAEDYLNKKADAEGIKAVFLTVDETRDSILEKQKKLEAVVQKFPEFRAGIMQLATTHLQLGRTKEALQVLQKYFVIDQNDPTVNYYLSMIYLERYDYNNAWKHYKKLESILTKQGHAPKALKELQDTLRKTSPAPLLKN